MIEECREFKYADRLALTGLTCLEDRLTRGDLIEVFKLVNKISKVYYK